MIPEAHIAHRAPNRLRVKVSLKKEHEGDLSTLPDEFTGISRIAEIEINPLTGSVLFKHGGKEEEIIDFIKKHGIFEITVKAPRPPPVHKGASSIYQQVDGLVDSFSNGSANAGGIAAMAL